MEGGGALPADNLLRRVAVSSPRHQPEHAPGAGAVRPVPETGDCEKNHRRGPSAAGNIHRHRLDAVGLSCNKHHCVFPQRQIFRHTHRLPDKGPVKGYPAVFRRSRRDGRLRLAAVSPEPAADMDAAGAAVHRRRCRSRSLRGIPAARISGDEGHRTRIPQTKQEIKDGQHSDHRHVPAPSGPGRTRRIPAGHLVAQVDNQQRALPQGTGGRPVRVP